MAPGLVFRPCTDSDQSAVLAIARPLVRAADTYAFDPDIDDDRLFAYWNPAAPGQGFVAEQAGEVVGVFVIRPNQPGSGSHVANASFAVAPHAQGQGLGRKMGEVALSFAKEAGYTAMQFNIVVSTNQPAIRLWTSLGFDIVGTVPNAFKEPDGKTVSIHVMHQELS